MLRFFVILLIALLLTILIQAVALTSVDLRQIDAGNFLFWFGNGCFTLLLAAIVGLHRKVEVTGRRAIAGVGAFLLVNLASLWLGWLLMDGGIYVGVLLYAPLSAIGWYPDGPDLAPAGASAVWAVSMLAPVILGAVIGLGLRAVLPGRQSAEAGIFT